RAAGPPLTGQSVPGLPGPRRDGRAAVIRFVYQPALPGCVGVGQIVIYVELECGSKRIIGDVGVSTILELVYLVKTGSSVLLGDEFQAPGVVRHHLRAADSQGWGVWPGHESTCTGCRIFVEAPSTG